MAWEDIIEIATAAECLSYLERRHPRWGAGKDCTWIFRGHADATWALQPRAWRDDARNIIRQVLEHLIVTCDGMETAAEVVAQYLARDSELLADPRGRLLSVRLQRQAEYEAIRQFANLADRVGLRVPEADAIPSGREFDEGLDMNEAPGEFSPSVAVCLAQHHGVPTRLLDWTLNPYVAAFFAAEEAQRLDSEYMPDPVSPPPLPSHIAIWALNLDWLHAVQQMPPSIDPPFGLSRVLCPRSEHSFLHAQDGLFLHEMSADQFFVKYGRWPTTDEAVRIAHNSKAPAPLRKVTVPFSEAGSLLRLLWREGVSRAQLMPTFDNVTATVMTNLTTFLS